MCTRKSDPRVRESQDSTSLDALFKTLPRQVDPYTKHSGSKHVSGRSFLVWGWLNSLIWFAIFLIHPGFMCCNCVIELGIPHRPRKEVALRDGTLLRRRSCVGPLFFKCWASGSFLRVGSISPSLPSSMRPDKFLCTLREAVICDDPPGTNGRVSGWTAWFYRSWVWAWGAKRIRYPRSSLCPQR